MQFLREYISLFQSNDILGRNELLPISQDEFLDGFANFQYNLSNNSEGVNAQLEERANLKLEIKFNAPLPDSIIIVLYALFDANIYISGDGTVVTDFD